MTRGFSLRWPVLIATIGAALAVLGLLLSGSIVSASAHATIDGGTWTFEVDSTGNTASVTASGLPSAGLGAADVTVAFDSSVIEITSCGTGDLAGACNPNAPGGPARAAGFAAPALTADPSTIATLTVDCVGAEGSSTDLTITVNEFVDGTAGDPQDITVTVQNGTVTCGPVATPTPSPTPSPTPVPSPVAVPDTGGPPPINSSDGGTGWIIALVAALGAAGLGVTIFGARSLRKRN